MLVKFEFELPREAVDLEAYKKALDHASHKHYIIEHPVDSDWPSIRFLADHHLRQRVSREWLILGTRTTNEGVYGIAYTDHRKQVSITRLTEKENNMIDVMIEINSSKSYVIQDLPFLRFIKGDKFRNETMKSFDLFKEYILKEEQEGRCKIIDGVGGNHATQRWHEDFKSYLYRTEKERLWAMREITAYAVSDFDNILSGMDVACLNGTYAGEPTLVQQIVLDKVSKETLQELKMSLKKFMDESHPTSPETKVGM